MRDTDRSILTTLAFAEAMRWPLTLMDIHERTGIPPSELLRRLDAVTSDGSVRSGFGMYALVPATADAFQARIEREKVTVQKWRRMRRYAFWLQAVPFVRALCAAGSLAAGMSGPDSDWDALVIVRSGRLYTARAFLLVATKLMGRLRTKRDAVAPDKFCFNHYVTTDGLEIRHRSRYVAHALCQLVPVFDHGDWLGKFWQANRWTAEYFHFTPGTVAHGHRSVVRAGLLQSVRRAAERLLSSRMGDWLEARLAAWQKGRIVREPATHESGGRVIADEQEIEFHPRSAESAVMDSFNRTLVRLGLAEFAENDSGLTR